MPKTARRHVVACCLLAEFKGGGTPSRKAQSEDRGSGGTSLDSVGSKCLARSSDVYAPAKARKFTPTWCLGEPGLPGLAAPLQAERALVGLTQRERGRFWGVFFGFDITPKDYNRGLGHKKQGN